MKAKKIIFFGLIFFNNFYGIDIYATGINIREEKEFIIIEWKSETNSYDFMIYRNFLTPINNLENLKKSELIFSNKINGEKKENYYLYRYKDNLIKNQQIFYLVLPVKKIDSSDFLPNINFNYKPFIVREEIKIKNIFARRYKESIILFWDVEGDSTYFRIYRSNRPFSGEYVEDNRYYIGKVDDLFYEDTDVKYGEDYYYIVLPQDSKKVTAENLVYVKAEYFPTNEIVVEKELRVREKIRKEDFIRNFTNQGKTNEK